MAKTSTLILLINSLTKAEKRSFILHTSRQKGAKDYLLLFRLIERGTAYAALKTSFKKGRPHAAYEATLKHLYKVITDCLMHLRMEQDKSTMLISLLLKANILFEKSLNDEGFNELKKIQVLAQEHEQYIIQLWAARLEIYYLCNLNFHGVTENELIKKQMKIQEITRYTVNIHQHNSLYELLRHRLVYKGHVRTAEQKKELEDLVINEMKIIANPLADSFESQKIHLLFQANYFITINDYKSALATFYDLNDLLEEHRYLWIDSPIDYLSAIEGILDSLRTIHEYKAMDYFIDKLKLLEKKSSYFAVMTQKVIYIYQLSKLIDYGDFKKAEQLIDTFEHTLFRKLSLLDADRQAEVYLYTALIYFGNRDINKAHFYLSKILLESKQYYNLPIYQTFRLIHLLVHYELENHDFVFHEIRSVRRKLKSAQGKSYKLEKIIFEFLQTPLVSVSITERETLWLKFKKSFEKIINDKYEIQVLKIFDFASWIEAKLCNKPFVRILKQKQND